MSAVQETFTARGIALAEARHDWRAVRRLLRRLARLQAPRYLIGEAIMNLVARPAIAVNYCLCCIAVDPATPSVMTGACDCSAGRCLRCNRCLAHCECAAGPALDWNNVVREWEAA